MAVGTPVWHGTYEEGQDLWTALKNNCGCDLLADGTPSLQCDAHRAFMGDQRFLDGLLVERRRRQQLLEQEYMASVEPE